MSHPQPNPLPSRAELWENVGREHCAGTECRVPGIVCHLTETYSVGGFQYTNLTDAIAQARRMAKLEARTSVSARENFGPDYIGVLLPLAALALALLLFWLIG